MWMDLVFLFIIDKNCFKSNTNCLIWKSGYPLYDNISQHFINYFCYNWKLLLSKKGFPLFDKYISIICLCLYSVVYSWCIGNYGTNQISHIDITLLLNSTLYFITVCDLHSEDALSLNTPYYLPSSDVLCDVTGRKGKQYCCLLCMTSYMQRLRRLNSLVCWRTALCSCLLTVYPIFFLNQCNLPFWNIENMISNFLVETDPNNFSSCLYWLYCSHGA